MVELTGTSLKHAVAVCRLSVIGLPRCKAVAMNVHDVFFSQYMLRLLCCRTVEKYTSRAPMTSP